MVFPSSLPVLLLSLTALTNAQIVEVNEGKLRGKVSKDLDGKEFYSFLSVPFAKPPLNELRFKDPQPPSSWEGVREATEDLPICFQKQWNDAFVGTEDCLYLNVHTPDLTPEVLKPVMFYIHGGGFTEGSGRNEMYGSEFLITKDVVVVTTNYRLGVMGFLNFENPAIGVPGNAALKDQTLALKWVKENIKNFGGDPEKITIFGESAGGGSVHLHVISPLSKGLFQRAISMSGTALNVWCNGIQNSGRIFAKQLGFSGVNEIEMLEYLQGLPLEQLQKTLEKATILIPLHRPNIFGPTIEKPSPTAFLPDTPRNLVKSGNVAKVPFMVGLTDMDGMIVDILHWVKYGKYNTWPVDKFLPYFFKLDETKRKAINEEFKNFYYKEGGTVNEVIDLATDAYFTNGIYETIFGHLNQQDVYFYVFSMDTKLNYFKRLHPVTASYKGCSHIDDLGHLFKNIFTPPEIKKDSVEDKAIRLAVRLFTNFAKYGDATREETTKWEKVGKSLNYLNIENDRVWVGYKPMEDRARFWCDIFRRYKPDVEFFCDWKNVKEEL